MGRLIDAEICLHEAWQNFYKQEDEHEKNIDGYDIMRDQFYEQSGFECCQQTIVNAPTVEAIPKANVIAMLEEIESMFWELTKNKYDMQILYEKADDFEIDFNSFIQRKIDKLKENTDGNK